MTATIDAARLRLFASGCDADVLAPHVSVAAVRAGITTPRRVRHWLSHVSVETAGLTRFTENLNYSAERLCAVWPGRFPNVGAATPFANNPSALGERVYGGRMGNVQPGDGGKFIGRGGLMRTGRSGYLAAQAAFAANGINIDLIAHPDMLALPAFAFEDAASFWLDHGLNAIADGGPEAAALEQETRIINGGLTGWDDRLAAMHRAEAIWPDDGAAASAPRTLADAKALHQP
jgi:putative chitinase